MVEAGAPSVKLVCNTHWFIDINTYHDMFTINPSPSCAASLGLTWGPLLHRFFMWFQWHPMWLFTHHSGAVFPGPQVLDLESQELKTEIPEQLWSWWARGLQDGRLDLVIPSCFHIQPTVWGLWAGPLPTSCEVRYGQIIGIMASSCSIIFPHRIVRIYIYIYIKLYTICVCAHGIS